MKNKGSRFWNKEYKHGGHLALSTEPAEDLVKFTRWLEREYGRKYLNPLASVLDLGCGNGRNVAYLVQSFGMRGAGIDVSEEAISQAKKLSSGLPIEYSVQSMADNFSFPDESQTIVLDMMTSHFLSNEERARLIPRIARVLRPGGWLFLKTFLRDEDVHAERLLRESPGTEHGSYIHPDIGVEEHVFTEEEISNSLQEFFTIHKITKSHRHKERAGAKRRSISIYAQKI